MSNERQRGGHTDGEPSAVGTLARYWAELSHDWQAVVLGAFVLLVVATGVPIPW